MAVNFHLTSILVCVFITYVPYSCLLYLCSAVLENHHVALSFKLTEQSKGLNIYQNLDRYARV